jgi:hypothetical protein
MSDDVGDWFDNNGSGQQVDLDGVLDAGNLDLVIMLVRLGTLVSIATTSDGGALGVTVTSDGRWRREYFRDPEPLRDWLSGAAEAVRALAGSATASSVPRQRKRSARGL